MISAAENAFKGILTSLPKPGGGEFGKFFSLPALNDPRIGTTFRYYISISAACLMIFIILSDKAFVNCV